MLSFQISGCGKYVCFASQSHKLAVEMEEQVSELCQRVEQGMKDASVSTKQANKWIFDQGSVSSVVSCYCCHFLCFLLCGAH